MCVFDILRILLIAKVDADTTDFMKTQRGVRQGRILSPLLFKLYSDAIFKEAKGYGNENQS